MGLSIVVSTIASVKSDLQLLQRKDMPQFFRQDFPSANMLNNVQNTKTQVNADASTTFGRELRSRFV